MTCNKFTYNWSTPDATAGKLNELEKDVIRLEKEINQQGLAFKREEGTDVFTITKDTIHSVNSTELKLYPIPDLSHVPPTGQIFAYTLPRRYVNTNNQVIGTVYTTLNENNMLSQGLSPQSGFNNPDIVKVSNQYSVSYYTSDKPGIKISDFNPFDMYTLGELRIDWIPKPTTLTSPAKVVCDIIDARNALQLYETPIPVFFRPVNYGEDDNYWWMTWGYKNDSAEFSKLLEGQPFRFTESSFGHNYTLYKNGESWSGNNMCTAFPSKTSYHSWSKGSVFSLFVSNSEGMKKQLRAMGIDPGSNTAYALRSLAKLYKSDGTLANVSTDWYTNSSETISGYDKAMCVVDDNSIKEGEIITCKIDINGSVSSLTSQASTSQSGLVWFTPIVNCLDSINYFKTSSITPQNELKLYMKKSEVFKFTDNNWNGSTNPFVYLNNVDGYNITPDPSSAATLTTPYSIVSNGVMLAENLESHTYKINDIGNDVTAINNQISNINNQIFTLQHFQSYIEEKNSWYNLLENKIISMFGTFVFKFALPTDINVPSLRSLQRDSGTLVPWQMSYEGIDSLPQLTFSSNTEKPIKAITYSTDATINDDESLPTTKWVNDKINSASLITSRGFSQLSDFIVGMTLKLKAGVNPPSSGTWERVGIWGVYDTTLIKSKPQSGESGAHGAKFHIYTTYNGMYATTNIRVSDSQYQESLALTDCGLAPTDSSTWFINSGYIASGSYPTGDIQIQLNNINSAEFKFNGANIEPIGNIHAFLKDSIFSFSVKITDFSNSSYKHQYVEWEKTA